MESLNRTRLELKPLRHNLKPNEVGALNRTRLELKLEPELHQVPICVALNRTRLELKLRLLILIRHSDRLP